MHAQKAVSDTNDRAKRIIFIKVAEFERSSNFDVSKKKYPQNKEIAIKKVNRSWASPAQKM